MNLSQTHKESQPNAAKANTPFFSPVVQKKMSIGTVNDVYENEANAIAYSIVRIPDSGTQNFSHTGSIVQRKCAHCEEEEKIQKKSLGESITPFIQKSSLQSGSESQAPNHIENQINTTKGSGNSMDHSTKHFMESRFETDFSEVRIHTGSQAVQMSRELNAQAFTVGNDIYFNKGKYSPNSDSGKHLLAHELTHTVQQEGLNEQVKQNISIQRTEEDEVVANRAAYLGLVRYAVAQMDNEVLADATFSDTIFPLLNEMTQDGAVVWRSSDGTETSGTGGSFRLPGRRGSSILYRLIIDEATHSDFNGLHSESDRTITLFKSNLTTVEGIRNTLYHEGIHLLTHLLATRGADSIGGMDDLAVQALSNDLNNVAKQELRRWLEFIRNNVNSRRASSSTAEIPESEIDSIINFLWDEITVRAATFYFALQIWLAERRTISDGLPNPNYFTISSLKLYLKQGGFLNQNDIDHLDDNDNMHIDSLQRRLMNNQRNLIKSRGVINAYIPHPSEPNSIIIPSERPRIDLGPMLELEPPRFLDEIIEDAREVE